MLGQPLIAPTTFGGRQYEGGEPQGMLLPRTVIPRGGISVTEDEDYKCMPFIFAEDEDRTRQQLTDVIKVVFSIQKDHYYE